MENLTFSISENDEKMRGKWMENILFSTHFPVWKIKRKCEIFFTFSLMENCGKMMRKFRIFLTFSFHFPGQKIGSCPQ
jgi:hypothetical protein